MVAIGYRRVSKKSSCCVCGKPDWCSTTTAETISFCARSTLNADRISPHGWGVFYHQRQIRDLYIQVEGNRKDEADGLGLSHCLGS